MTPKPKTGKIKLLLIGLVDAALLVLCLVQIFHPIFHFGNFGLFNAQGTIAQAQGRLIILAILLMLLIAVPVIITGYTVAFRYREGANRAYEPDWGERHKHLQFLWWACPALIIALISIINFKSAHELDPTRVIPSPLPPLTVQVVALQWKWLFIYPAQRIATVNFLEIPQNVPVNFELTAEGPMSLFWIPQLGGQMAAMAGMETRLNLMATKPGQFVGQNSEINGSGYAHMQFAVNSVPPADFNSWANSLQASPPLTESAYQQLLTPSQDAPPAYFSYPNDSLYNSIMMKYMEPPTPSATPGSMDDMPGMEMH
ncbi:MAG TPA: COX aromatic rich motif-containing protein [Patescibacteria group bacterium]|nr:COX aromatic rich motif-containing protein [Patescibacteria group bacterium]